MALWLKPKLVGENGGRDGLSLELLGLLWPVLIVDIGVGPRRAGARLLLPVHADCCDLVLRAPDVGLAVLGREGSWEAEKGGTLIEPGRA